MYFQLLWQNIILLLILKTEPNDKTGWHASVVYLRCKIVITSAVIDEYKIMYSWVLIEYQYYRYFVLHFNIIMKTSMLRTVLHYLMIYTIFHIFPFIHNDYLSVLSSENHTVLPVRWRTHPVYTDVTERHFSHMTLLIRWLTVRKSTQYFSTNFICFCIRMLF